MVDLVLSARRERRTYRQIGQMLPVGISTVARLVDDHSRVAFSAILPDERAASACRGLLHALRYYRTLGVHFSRVMTDSGACYKSHAFRRSLRRGAYMLE